MEVHESKPAANAGGSTISAPAPIERNAPAPAETLRVKPDEESNANMLVDERPTTVRQAGEPRIEPAEPRRDLRPQAVSGAPAWLVPLPEGLVFQFASASGQGGMLSIQSDGRGGLAFTLHPDKGNAVGITVSGEEADRLRRAVCGPTVE